MISPDARTMLAQYATEGTITHTEDIKRHSPTTEFGNGTRKLQDEINVLTKKNCGEQISFL